MKRLRLILMSLAACFVGGLRGQFAPSGMATANAESLAQRHADSDSRLADAAFASRHLLVQAGTDKDHVNVCQPGNCPVGVTDDMPILAGDIINVHFLAASKGTKRLIATAALTNETEVFTAANGQVQSLPNVAGTYHRIGRTKSASSLSSDNLNIVEVETAYSLKVIVDANGNAVFAL